MSRNSLTPKQLRGVAALIQAHDKTRAAEMAGVHIKTIERWMGMPEFRAKLREHENQALDVATRRLIKLQGTAIDALQKMLENSKTTDANRIKVAIAVMDYGMRLLDLRDIERRIEALEGQGVEL